MSLAVWVLVEDGGGSMGPRSSGGSWKSRFPQGSGLISAPWVWVVDICMGVDQDGRRVNLLP